jgi:ATP-dependent Lon protease
MRESAQTAHSYIRTRAEELGIETNFADQMDLHLHLPEGAVPKDGPSAGITIATAMISALTNRPVRADTAMTGEITLRGRVLGIGGLKEKVLAAHHASIYNLLLPAENSKELAEIPAKIRQSMHFTSVDNMDRVIEAALLPAPVSPVAQDLHEREDEEPGPLPLHLDERAPANHKRKMASTLTPADVQNENEPFLIPPADRSINSDSYPSAQAQNSEEDV